MFLSVCLVFTLVSLKSLASCSNKDLQQNNMGQNNDDNFLGNDLYQLLAMKISDVSSLLHTNNKQSTTEFPVGRVDNKTGSFNSGIEKRRNDCKLKRWIYLPCLRKNNMGQLTAKQAKHYAKMMHVLFGIGK